MIKVLLIEDEPGIRDSLSHAIHWTEIGCELSGAVESGLAALDFCFHTQPDIIISDIVMPEIDGLSLMKYIKGKYPDIRFIILTGHREFNYAKDAVNIGADFFILKPINYNELISALATLADKIFGESEKIYEETQKVQMLRILLSDGIYSRKDVSPRTHHFFNHLRTYRVLVVKFDSTFANDPFKMQSLSIYFENNNIFKDYLMTKGDDYSLVVLIPFKDTDSIKDLTTYLNQIRQKTASFFQATISIGVSEILEGYENIHTAYMQALRALGERFFTGRNSTNIFVSEKSFDSTAPTDYNFIFQSVKRAKEIISQYENDVLISECKALFNDFIGSCKQNSGFIKSSMLIFIVSLIQKILGDQSKRYILFYEKHSNFQKVIECDTLEDIEKLYLDIIIELKEYAVSKSSSHSNIIIKVNNYIQEHYHENITLNDVSKTVYLSSSYLSSLITSETGKSFVDILNETRIERAIDLLKNPKKKISNIAYDVGFNEPQYFTLTFKKYTGLTPRNYRDVFLKNES